MEKVCDGTKKNGEKCTYKFKHEVDSVNDDRIVVKKYYCGYHNPNSFHKSDANYEKLNRKKMGDSSKIGDKGTIGDRVEIGEEDRKSLRRGKMMVSYDEFGALAHEIKEIRNKLEKLLIICEKFKRYSKYAILAAPKKLPIHISKEPSLQNNKAINEMFDRYNTLRSSTIMLNNKRQLEKFELGRKGVDLTDQIRRSISDLSPNCDTTFYDAKSY